MHNPPSWYTNDDFRMMTIVSGAYSGTPSPDIVFMRYPIGLLLSGLYRITTSVPWYGLFTMLCMFFPSCVFCYYIVKKAYEKNRVFAGIFLYFLLFMLFIQKYVCLPQFTLTSAFLGVGAFALLHEMPDKAYCSCLHICRFFVFDPVEGILSDRAGADMGYCGSHISG